MTSSAILIDRGNGAETMLLVDFEGQAQHQRIALSKAGASLIIQKLTEAVGLWDGDFMATNEPPPVQPT